MATMLPNIALFAETEQRGTLNPLCLVAASEYRATRELVEDSRMATMVGAAWLRYCEINKYLHNPYK
jgi:hypothetical protein